MLRNEASESSTGKDWAVLNETGAMLCRKLQMLRASA